MSATKATDMPREEYESTMRQQKEHESEVKESAEDKAARTRARKQYRAKESQDLNEETTGVDNPWAPGGEDGDHADWLERVLNHEVLFNYGTEEGKGRWHVYDPKTGLWLPDLKNDVTERVDTLNTQRLSTLLLNGRPTTSRDITEKAYRTLRNKSRIDSTLGLLATRSPYKTTNEEPDIVFDNVPYLLGVKNGAVDLRSATFVGHDDLVNGKPLREWYLSRRANVAWPVGREDEAYDMAVAGEFDWFIRDIMGGDDALARYLFRWLGYCLFGWTIEEKFWLLVGRGRNGKGTLVKFMHWLLGTYSHFTPSNLYIRNRNGDPGADRARPEFLALRGKRFAPTSEPVKGAFNEELLKAHTGRDPITARNLYQGGQQTFDPTHKLAFLTQDEPAVEDVGPSMRARARVIRFEQSYVGREDPGLQSRLERSGSYILVMLAREAAAYWAAIGLAPGEGLRDADIVATGLPEPAKVTEWSKQYVDSNDPLALFIERACRTGADLRVSAHEAYTAYMEWHNREHVEGEPMTQTMFGRKFASPEHGVTKSTDRNGTHYLGVRPLGAMALAEREEADED